MNPENESKKSYLGTLATVKEWREKHQRWQVLCDLDNDLRYLKEANMTTDGVEQNAEEVEA